MRCAIGHQSARSTAPRTRDTWREDPVSLGRLCPDGGLRGDEGDAPRLTPLPLRWRAYDIAQLVHKDIGLAFGLK
jgi:hypothetical protein